MQVLNLPSYPFRIRDENGKRYIFDELRKKHLVLTPEEWVRQHMIQYLVLHKKYPKGLIKLEGGLKVNTVSARSDILVYNREGLPHLLVECKAPSITLNQQVFDQAARYNFTHRVKLLVISNGMEHYCCEMDYIGNSYAFLEEIPTWKK